MRKRAINNQLYHKTSLKKKLMLMSVVIILPVLLFLIVVYGFWLNFLQQEIMNSFINSYQQYALTVKDNLMRRQIVVQTLSDSSKVQELVSNENEAESEEIFRLSVKPVLDALTESAPHGQMIWIVRYDNQGYEYINNDYEGLLSNIRRNSMEIENGLKDYSILHMSRLNKQYWFRSLKEDVEEARFQQLNMDYLNHCFSLVSEIKHNNSAVGLVRVISPLEDLIGEEVETMPVAENISFVLDEDYYLLSTKTWKRQFMADNYSSLFREAIMSLREGKKYCERQGEWFVSAEKIGDTGLNLVVLGPAETIVAKSQQLQTILIVCIITIFLFVCVFIFSISNYLKNRLQHLLNAMRRFQKGDFHSTVTVRSNDEIGMLYAGYNEMTNRIDALMQRNVEIAIEREKAELELLQMQINPHFLYNSLSTIFRLSEFGENEKIKKMVTALTKFYRLSLNKGYHIYSVRNEKEQLEAYLEIFNVRKGTTFSSEMAFEPASYDCYVPKLLLQPFVENIFQHAFDEEHTYVNIQISQHVEDNYLVFCVKDDGCGIDESILEELHQGNYTSNDGGFGIFNVEARLKILYGDDYCFRIESPEGEGVTVHIRIPVKTKEQLSGNI